MVGADKNLLVMDHAHTFINIGGQIGDFQLEHRYMALVHFLSTNQLKTYDKARNAVALALSPAVRALVDPDGAMSDIWNLDSTNYFSLFATKTEASLLRMLKGSPDVYLSGPISNISQTKGADSILGGDVDKYVFDKSAHGDTYVMGLAMSKATNKQIVKADAYVAAYEVPVIKRLLPTQWRELEFCNNIYKLVGVPVVTVQLRYSGWVMELQDLERSRQLRQAAGLDNLLYTPDADFSFFADLALASSEDYYIEGQGSLPQFWLYSQKFLPCWLICKTGNFTAPESLARCWLLLA